MIDEISIPVEKGKVSTSALGSLSVSRHPSLSGITLELGAYSTALARGRSAQKRNHTLWNRWIPNILLLYLRKE